MTLSGKEAAFSPLKSPFSAAKRHLVPLGIQTGRFRRLSVAAFRYVPALSLLSVQDASLPTPRDPGNAIWFGEGEKAAKDALLYFEDTP